MDTPIHNTTQLDAIVLKLRSEEEVNDFLSHAMTSGDISKVSEALLVAAKARSYMAIAELQAQAQELGLYDAD